MISRQKLKPCPFCGGEAELVTFYIKGVANRKNHFARCRQNHFCRTRNYRSRNDAIEAWNKRAEPPADQWIPFTGEYDKKEGRVVLTCPIPDDDEEIMVTDGKYVWEDTFMNDGEDCWLDGSNKFLVEEVTAWMPKPEPYKREEPWTD